MSTVFFVLLCTCDSIDKHKTAVYNFDNRTFCNCMKSLPLSYMRYCNNFVYDINYCHRNFHNAGIHFDKYQAKYGAASPKSTII